jgi:predicted nucleic acid-binding protein
LLVRKRKQAPAQARIAILAWRDAYGLIETSEGVLVAAIELAATHRFSFWDAVVLTSASEGGCRLLLSEGLQEGFAWNGVTVANPFAASPNPLLLSFLK